MKVCAENNRADYRLRLPAAVNVGEQPGGMHLRGWRKRKYAPKKIGLIIVYENPQLKTPKLAVAWQKGQQRAEIFVRKKKIWLNNLK